MPDQVEWFTMRLIINEIELVSVVSQVVKLIKMRRRALFIPRALTRVKKIPCHRSISGKQCKLRHDGVCKYWKQMKRENSARWKHKQKICSWKSGTRLSESLTEKIVIFAQRLRSYSFMQHSSISEARCQSASASQQGNFDIPETRWPVLLRWKTCKHVRC